MEDGKKEIPPTTKWLMLAVAIFFDILSLSILIPVVGWIAGWIVWVFAFGTLWLWFMMNGVNIFGFRNPKKLIGSLLATIVEAVPEIGAFPSWTFLVLYLTRAEKIINKVVDQVPGGSNVIKFVPRSSKTSGGTVASENSDLEKAA